MKASFINVRLPSNSNGGFSGDRRVEIFKEIGLPEKQELAKKIQKTCGVGCTVKGGRIEIRGDLRDVVKKILEEAGFQPVFAGG